MEQKKAEILKEANQKMKDRLHVEYEQLKQSKNAWARDIMTNADVTMTVTYDDHINEQLKQAKREQELEQLDKQKETKREAKREKEKREKQKKEKMATMNHLAPQEYEELLYELQKISEMDATNKYGVGSEHTE